MSNSVQTLTGLVENILDISKLESGILKINQKDFDLHFVCESVLQSLIPLAQAKNLYVKDNIAQGTKVNGDQILIARVFSNLISNAIKFTDKGGIEIDYSCDGQNHIITVKDTGLGIKQGELEKIFEKYHQGDVKVKGYGLGLTITRQIVLAHRGAISAFSEGPHKGTQIVFTLPCAAQTAEDITAKGVAQ
jgi:signal transduction histidine kinase